MKEEARLILLAAGIAAAVVAWMFRFDVQTVARGGEGTIPAAYVLDRWTGTVRLIVGIRATEVEPNKTAPQ